MARNKKIEQAKCINFSFYEERNVRDPITANRRQQNCSLTFVHFKSISQRRPAILYHPINRCYSRIYTTDNLYLVQSN